MFDQTLITEINTPQYGVAGAKGENPSDGGVAAAPLLETVLDTAFDDPSASLELTPYLYGGTGGTADSSGADGASAVVTPTTVTSNDVTTTTLTPTTPAESGVIGGTGGAGAATDFEFTDDSVGTAALPNGGGLYLSSQVFGGYGGGGGAGGHGGSGNASGTQTIYQDGQPFATTVNIGGDGGNGAAGGVGGAGAAGIDRVTGLLSYTDGSATITLNGEGGVGGDGGNGGFGGSGDLPTAGGDGGAGGAGGLGEAALSDSTVSSTYGLVVGLNAAAGYAGSGGTGGDGGDAISLYNVSDSELGENWDFGRNGNGGAGGAGGNATAQLNDDILTSQSVSIQMSVLTHGAAAGGGPTLVPPSSSGLDGSAGYVTITESAQGAVGAAGSLASPVQGGEGSGIVFTGNTVNATGTYSELSLSLSDSVYTPGVSDAGVPLSEGTNLIFSGNTFTGGGVGSAIDFDVPGGGVVVDTAHDTLSIGGSPGNAMTGFDTFYLGADDTFIKGAGDYTVYLNPDPDTVVLTPTAGTLTLSGTSATDLVLNFQGFGSSLDTLTQLEDDTTQNSNGDTVISTPGGGVITLDTANFPENSSAIEFSSAACFVAGTRILTARREAALEQSRGGLVTIESLEPGDVVLTGGGETRSVRWVGHRQIDCSRYPDPTQVWPIRIQSGAFADDMPMRDLWVSPGHSLLVDGVLIQACNLVNGATIVQVARDRVDYWHVELDSHDIIVAEGLPTESYLDTGNRTAFIDGGAFLEAHPDFAPKHWADTCVPLVQEGPQLVNAKAALLARAAELGYATTENSDMHLLADGERLEPTVLSSTRIAFLVSAGCSLIELRSRMFVPGHADANSGDRRSLGICVGRIQIDGGDVALDDDAVFESGWYELEQYADHQQRWTRDCARLPAGSRLVVIDIASRSHCWAKPPKSEMVATLFR